MQKIKIINFFLILSIILGLYYLFIININKFIKNNDNTIISYKNNYNYDNSEDNVFENILSNPKIETITKLELEQILNNDLLLNLISEFSKTTVSETLNNLKENGNLNLYVIKPSNYDFNLIYLSNQNGTLAFSLDGKNIAYSILLPGVLNNLELENIMETIESASKCIKDKLNKIGLTNSIGFEITSIRKSYQKEYNNNYGSIYYIEDVKHNIKITYNYTYDTIYSLILGF